MAGNPLANASTRPRTYSAIAWSKTPREFVRITRLAASSGNRIVSTPALAAWIQRRSRAWDQASRSVADRKSQIRRTSAPSSAWASSWGDRAWRRVATFATDSSSGGGGPCGVASTTTTGFGRGIGSCRRAGRAGRRGMGSADLVDGEHRGNLEQQLRRDD